MSEKKNPDLKATNNGDRSLTNGILSQIHEQKRERRRTAAMATETAATAEAGRGDLVSVESLVASSGEEEERRGEERRACSMFQC